MINIYETIVVEGKSDIDAVRKACNANIIPTHGYGLNDDIYQVIEKAYKETGIIIFTDPDYAGENIRKKLTERFPEAKHAFLVKSDAIKDGNIGVENALPEDIKKALESAATVIKNPKNQFDWNDMFVLGLAGVDGSAEKRRNVGKELGIGYANGKVFHNRLNSFGISREELLKALGNINDKEPSGKAQF